jgi:hypothetical protein
MTNLRETVTTDNLISATVQAARPEAVCSITSMFHPLALSPPIEIRLGH